MGIRWLKPVMDGLKFSVMPKRWLPFFIVDLIFLTSLISYIWANLSSFTLAMQEMIMGSTASMGGILGIVATIAVIGVIWLLIKLWVAGAVVHQTYKPKEFRKSFTVSYRKYFSLLVASIIVGIINFLVNFIPFFNGVVSTIVVAVFFFYMQGIIIRNQGAIDALKGTWRIFRGTFRNFQASFKSRLFTVWVIVLVLLAIVIGGAGVAMAAYEAMFLLWAMIAVFITFLFYSKVYDMWAITALLMFAISLIFLIPALAMVLVSMLPALATGSGTAIAASALLMLSNLPLLAVMGAIVLVGTSISSVLGLKIATEYYLQVKGRK